jgi:hypothetical protein
MVSEARELDLFDWPATGPGAAKVKAISRNRTQRIIYFVGLGLLLLN